jgi:hypothetical protein
MTAIERLLEAAFSVGSTPRLYSEDPRPAEGISVESQPVQRRLGGLCEMATSLEPCQLRVVSWEEFYMGGCEEKS